MFSRWLALVALFSLVGCGAYQSQIDEKEKNEKLAKKRADRIDELEAEKKHLMNALSNVRIGSEFVWVFLSRQATDVRCGDIGYKKADGNDAMKSEYISEIKPNIDKEKIGKDTAEFIESVIVACGKRKDA